MSDPVAAISAAAELLERGHLTQDEFAQLKARILTAPPPTTSEASEAAPARHNGRLLQLTRHLGAQQEGAAAEKSGEALRAERKAADEAGFKRMCAGPALSARPLPLRRAPPTRWACAADESGRGAGTSRRSRRAPPPP